MQNSILKKLANSRVLSILGAKSAKFQTILRKRKIKEKIYIKKYIYKNFSSKNALFAPDGKNRR